MSKQVKQHQGTLLNVSLAGTYILHAQVCLLQNKKKTKKGRKQENLHELFTIPFL